MKRRDFIFTTATGSALLATGNLSAFPKMPDSIKSTSKFCAQSARKIPVAYTVDVVVVGGSTAAVIGIIQTSTTASFTQTISGNTIYDLSSTNLTASTQVYGIYYSGPVSGTNAISGNFVHSLNVSTSNIGATINGIVLNTGVLTCANNIINLGVGSTVGYLINGIWDGSVNASDIFNIYFNTVYIGGTVASGVNSNTSCLWDANNVSTRNYRNNILNNTRTGGSTGKHYAIRIAGTANSIFDYNDYFFVTGGTLGKIGTVEKTYFNCLANRYQPGCKQFKYRPFLF